MSAPLWQSFKTHYLDAHGLTVEKIYNSEYNHGDAYVVAESLAEFDELFQRFRYVHVQLIQRTIGLHSKSLKGRPVDRLKEGAYATFFPELWEIRSQMTDTWGSQYGVVRDSLSAH
jgi:tryptophan 2,3-dioxygenase